MKITKNQLIALLKEIAFPTLAAIAYIAAIHFNPTLPDSGLFKDIAALSVGFTALLFLQEQYQRVVKKVNDAEAFEKLHGEVSEARKSIDVLLNELRSSHEADAFPERRVATPLRQPIATSAPDGTIGFAQQGLASLTQVPAASFTQQSATALRHGLPLPAVLVAAVAFEQAMVDAATRIGIVDANRKGGMQLLRQIVSENQVFAKTASARATIERLHKLIQLRNRLFHAHPDELDMTLDRAMLAVEEFDSGVQLLAKIASQESLREGGDHRTSPAHQ